jgi:hypothetical protein
MTVFYVETGRGVCLREGRSLESVRASTLREVGTLSGVSVIREASKRDIEWVAGMGGYLPESAKRKIQEVRA